MKKKVALSYVCPIPWEEMESIDDKERFCSQCQTNVRDFTKDQNPDTTDVKCGQFYLDQLSSINRTFSIKRHQVLAISLFTLLGLAPSSGLAQQENGTTAQHESQVLGRSSFHVKGIVRDSRSGHTVPSAHVIARYGNSSILHEGVTNFNGNFSFDLPAEKLRKGDIIIEVTLPGYQKNSEVLTQHIEKKLVEIYLEPVVRREPLPKMQKPYIVRGVIPPPHDVW